MNKTVKGLSFLMVSAMAALSSCSDESPWYGSDTTGGISLEVSADGRVMRQTRADDEDKICPVTPLVEEFAVNLSSSNGSYSKDWSSIAAFNKEGEFPIDDYIITAYYGDIDKEGFTNPCFVGKTNVHVAPNSHNDAQIVATLGHAMVSVRYSDEFNANFPTHSASVQTDGHERVMFAPGENRPAFIAPCEDVKLNLSLTNADGKQVTIQPAGFKAEARHHYVVTFGVDGTSGDLALKVEFDEDVVNKTVEVSLGEDLFTSPAPTISAKGFEPNAVIEGFEHLTKIDDAEFQVFAFGGLREANFNFVTDSKYIPAFGKSVQLVNASDDVQQKLTAENLVCGGFFQKVDKMGFVKFGNFISNLPAGNHSIELSVVDAMTRVSDPVKLTLKLEKVQFDFGAPSDVLFGATEVSVIINTNCPDIKNLIAFKAPDANNRMTQVEVKNVEDAAAQAGWTHCYKYTLAVDPQNGTEVDVEASFGGTTIYTSLPVVLPDFDIVADAFANHVTLRISCDSADPMDVINHLTFYNGSTPISASYISYEANQPVVKVSNLAADTEYASIKAVFGSMQKNVPSFHTEKIMNVPNGDFSKVSQTIYFQNVQSGGTFGSALSTKKVQSTIVRSTPEDWANLNSLTCYENTNPKNTWFMVPSTWTVGGETVIRSVGYNHNGSVPSKSSGNYCSNTPTEAQLQKSVGELFLGTYEFNGTDGVRTDGINFTSRPSSLSFSYKYAPVNNEQAEVYITVLSGDGQEISTTVAYLDRADAMTAKTIVLPSYPFGSKAAKIMVGFKSTRSDASPSIVIPSGNALDDGASFGLLASTATLPDNEYKAVAVGSVLTVSNVSLGYDPKAKSNVTARRGAAKSNSYKTTSKRR